MKDGGEEDNLSDLSDKSGEKNITSSNGNSSFGSDEAGSKNIDVAVPEAPSDKQQV